LFDANDPLQNLMASGIHLTIKGWMGLAFASEKPRMQYQTPLERLNDQTRAYRMLQRLRTFAQMTTYLGTAVIVIIWGTVFYLAHDQRDQTSKIAIQQGTNLARIFEEYISRVLGGADTTLLALRELYGRDPQHFDIARLTGREPSKDIRIVEFGIVGADGIVKLGTASMPGQISLTDRDYFSFQAQAKGDNLYIGAPVIGRVSGRPSFILSRRLAAPDGSFEGVILAAIDIRRLEEFYNSIDIGANGAISLTGFDGVLRARSGRNATAHEWVGKSIAHMRLFSLYRQAPSGHYWNLEIPEPQFDGVARLVSYHVVDGFPLIAIVGLAESDIFEEAIRTERKYYLIGVVLSACVIGAIGIGASRQEKLSSTMAALEQVNLRFSVALKNLPHGLSMFDKDQRLILCNERYCEIYGLTPEQTKPGTTLASIQNACVPFRNSRIEIETDIAQRMRAISNSQPMYAEYKLHDGRIIAMNLRPMPDGGSVAIHQDITERKRAEEHQGVLIAELDHRVKNVLARVAVVVKYTLQGGNSMDERNRALEGRIQSMADAHTLLSQSRWRGAGVADLVRRQLAPYTTETNVTIDGADITLSAVATQALAMVLQELVTNAVKYGSLSNSHGQVSVRWDRQKRADEARLVIEWRETGGPSATVPNHSSYGTKLIRNLIPHELGGTVDLTFPSAGLRCVIKIPLNEEQTAN
jgi:PAS domain S-box-containing protein